MQKNQICKGIQEMNHVVLLIEKSLNSSDFA
jgi:hypothetical protein